MDNKRTKPKKAYRRPTLKSLLPEAGKQRWAEAASGQQHGDNRLVKLLLASGPSDWHHTFTAAV